MNFKQINVVTQNKIIKTSLEIKDGKIASIGETSNKDGLALDEYYLVPGFIDQHIHGAAGFDFMDADKDAINKISEALLEEGTTSFLGTTMTQSDENITKAVSSLVGKTKGANLLGVHLEGPFLSVPFKGAQPEEFIIKPSIELFKKWNKNNNIKIVSMAPENDSNYEFIKYCKKEGIIVSLAHTNANHEEAQGALDNGAKGFTHGYNAMSKLHHRDINMVGTMLLDENSYAELIADGIHVSSQASKLLYKNKGRDNMILITDSMRAKYLPDGKSKLGGQEVIVANNEARLADGTLAGSILKMNDAIRNIMKFANISLVDAVYMAATTPAKNLGLKTKGYIAKDMDADLVVLDKELNVIQTIVGGKTLFNKETN